MIRIGYAVGAVPARAGLLETALSLSGVLFDMEVYDGEPDWPGVIDFFGRVLAPALAADRAAGDGRTGFAQPLGD